MMDADFALKTFARGNTPAMPIVVPVARAKQASPARSRTGSNDSDDRTARSTEPVRHRKILGRQILGSGWEVGHTDLDPVCMQRPIAQRLCLAEFSLRQFGGLTFGRSVDLERALADFTLVSVFAKHIFHEVNDIA
jgi:hypothetical protein